MSFFADACAFFETAVKENVPYWDLALVSPRDLIQHFEDIEERYNQGKRPINLLIYVFRCITQQGSSSVSFETCGLF